jgi:hypothetical protein
VALLFCAKRLLVNASRIICHSLLCANASSFAERLRPVLAELMKARQASMALASAGRARCEGVFNQVIGAL